MGPPATLEGTVASETAVFGTTLIPKTDDTLVFAVTGVTARMWKLLREHQSRLGGRHPLLTIMLFEYANACVDMGKSARERIFNNIHIAARPRDKSIIESLIADNRDESTWKNKNDYLQLLLPSGALGTPNGPVSVDSSILARLITQRIVSLAVLRRIVYRSTSPSDRVAFRKSTEYSALGDAIETLLACIMYWPDEVPRAAQIEILREQTVVEIASFGEFWDSAFRWLADDMRAESYVSPALVKYCMQAEEADTSVIGTTFVLREIARWLGRVSIRTQGSARRSALGLNKPLSGLLRKFASSHAGMCDPFDVVGERPASPTASGRLSTGHKSVRR